jgi:hypothetical protein
MFNLNENNHTVMSHNPSEMQIVIDCLRELFDNCNWTLQMGGRMEVFLCVKLNDIV